MRRVVNGLVYDTEKAILIAHDRFWDGQNFERRGRNVFLYKTPGGTVLPLPDEHVARGDELY